MEQLKHSGCDGSHRGLGDWYSDLEANIVAALAKGPDHKWTTGWYASKHEIATACITYDGMVITVEASVSDDFDTPGYGSGSMEYTTDLDKIREKIYEVWDEADENKKDNEVYIGYSVIGYSKRLKTTGWIETYIKDAGYGLDAPPGDNYLEWGWQGESDIDPEILDKLEEWALTHDEGEFTYKEYTIKPWKD